MNLENLLQLLLPVLIALAGSGGIVAYFAYKTNKPKTAAESQKLQADVVVTFAEGWKQLAEKMESRVNKLEEDILKIRTAMDDQDEKYRLIIKEKDREIAELRERSLQNVRRIDDLEKELLKYQKTDVKVDIAKVQIDTVVKESLETLKKK